MIHVRDNEHGNGFYIAYKGIYLSRECTFYIFFVATKAGRCGPAGGTGQIKTNIQVVVQFQIFPPCGTDPL